MDHSFPPKRQGTESETIGSNAHSMSCLRSMKRLTTSNECKGCDEEYVVGGSNHSTSSSTSRMSKCPKQKSYHNVGNMLLDHVGKVRSRKISQKVLHDLIAMAIIRHDLSFSFVEYEGIKEILKYCNPDVKFINRNSVVANVRKLYMSEKENLKQELAKIPSRICLTFDVWTACNTKGYICLTTHYVDSNWTLCNKILTFCDMPPPHSGYELSKKVMDILKEWGIEKKIFSITLHNASSNSMQEILKEKLCIQNNLLCNGEFFHVRCSAHILNLIVQEGLKVVHDTLYKIRESVKYVKSSEGRMKKFEECVKNVGIDHGVVLCLDVPTRWDSTFVMLENALKYRLAFVSFQIEDESYTYCPSSHEWERGEKMCEFFRPFYDITNLISGSTYPTSNIYFIQIWSMECLLIDNANNEDEIIKDMAIRMKTKFDEYWSEYSIVLALGAILDLRLKFPLLERCLNKVDPASCQSKLKVVRKTLFALFNVYANNSAPSSSSSSSQTHPPNILGSSVKGLSSFMALEDMDSQIFNEMGKSQLELYLEEAKLEFGLFKDLDVLQYWKKNRIRFPALSLMAIDILSIPITTATSESAFSIGSHDLNKYRSCLLPEKVQALICTRNWLHGFNAEDKY